MRVRIADVAVGLLLTVVVAFAAALAGGSAQGAQAGARVEGLIAFTRADGIYVMRPDGTGVRPLRRGPVASQASALDWSPDGSRLAFLARGEIWVMNADGSDPARLTGPFPSWTQQGHQRWMSPSWSPDGRRIAGSYAGTPKADRDVWVMNADGSDKHRLARTRSHGAAEGCQETAVDWSPTHLGFVVTCAVGWGFRDLALIDANARVRRLVETSPRGVAGGVVGDPHWSPDGRRIVFEPDNGGIWVMNASGRARAQVTSTGTHPAWSPDGRKFAFVRGDWGTDSSEIYVMDADGRGVRRLTHNRVADGLSLAWQAIPSAP
jgi:Tol biopolymer transport system component